MHIQTYPGSIFMNIYFDSVGIKKYRYAVTCGLLADVAGMIAAVFISYFFWG